MLYANDPDFYSSELEQLARVTPAQVQAAAMQWLSPAGARASASSRRARGLSRKRQLAQPISAGRGGGARRPQRRQRQRADGRRRRPLAAARRSARSPTRLPGDRARPPLERHPGHLFARRTARAGRPASRSSSTPASPPIRPDRARHPGADAGPARRGHHHLNSIQIAEAQERLGADHRAPAPALDRTERRR